MINKIKFVGISLIAVFVLSGCTDEKDGQDAEHDMAVHKTEDSNEMDHSTMNHSSDGEIPPRLQESTDPAFPIGSKAIIKANHMEGMNNAEATIVGAYDTTVYTVSYTPINGEEPVSNHKWVIHQELEGAGETPLKPGDKATIKADHMEGMKGATATIDTAITTTVYLVDYVSTSGEKVTNHKWVTESELSEK